MGVDEMRIERVAEAERYEMRVGGELAGRLEYRGGGEVRALTHTEIEPAFEGQGLGSRLVRFALDDARADGLKIVPICPFVTRFLHEHHEYLDLVEPYIRKAFKLPG